jgi:hypothetical protein
MEGTLIQELIVEKAMEFIGQEENAGNMGFKSKWFDRLMRSVGFVDTHAWCVYFAELVWTKTYEENDARKLPALKKLFTGGAVRTFRRFKADDRFQISTQPIQGSLVFWQKYKNGKPTTQGHCAICTKTTFAVTGLVYSIDGNTNDNGSREGIKVAEKSRNWNMGSKSGLVLLGFVVPPGIEGTNE